MVGSSTAFQSSIGIDTNTGPHGGLVATWIARASTAGTSAGRAGSRESLTVGRGSIVASGFVSRASRFIIGRTCCPAVTTSGAPLADALTRAPTALPTPGAVCRLTRVGRPRAWA